MNPILNKLKVISTPLKQPSGAKLYEIMLPMLKYGNLTLGADGKFAVESYNHSIASFIHISPGFCCGETRIGHFSYNFFIPQEPTDDCKGHWKDSIALTNEEVLEILIRLIKGFEAIQGRGAFVRGNLNRSYPIWDKALIQSGFQIIAIWRNGHRQGTGSYMTEYAKIRFPVQTMEMMKRKLEEKKCVA
ncbi:MAG: hypothetical protein ACREBU_03540 [Nitrososphaera sp.]